MIEKEIVDVIYQYYPKGLTNDQTDEIINSTAHKRRSEKCKEVGLNWADIWIRFKGDLMPFLESMNSSAADYSRFGTTPAYFLQVGLDKYKNSDGQVRSRKLLHVFISVIVPFWSYRFSEPGPPHDWRYSTTDGFEEKIISGLDELIKKHFHNYEYMSEQISKVEVPDIVTPTNDGPIRIFDAVFGD